MKKGRAVCVIALLFMACVGGQCRPETQRAYQDDRADVTTMDLSENESKIKLIMCLARNCKTKGEPSFFKECICCVTQPGIPCYSHTKECQANCPPVKSK
uniref:Uncharacterized protein n=1 Tax=Avena sativa TaxID=4498 RepID=A0ACD5TZI1_AVESA